MRLVGWDHSLNVGDPVGQSLIPLQNALVKCARVNSATLSAPADAGGARHDVVSDQDTIDNVTVGAGTVHATSVSPIHGAVGDRETRQAGSIRQGDARTGGSAVDQGKLGSIHA